MDPAAILILLGGGLLLATRAGKKRRRKREPTVGEEPDVQEKPPTNGVDQALLTALGYTSVLKFQKDFNLVQAYRNIWDRVLSEDGQIGPNTRGAMTRAQEYANQLGETWQAIVAEVRENAKLTNNQKGNLQTLGYDPVTYRQIFEFQQDFNKVNRYLDENQIGTVLPLTLRVDGIFGKNTEEAVAAAQRNQIDLAMSWQDLVKEAS